MALAVAAGDTWLRAEQPATLDVAYAGSMGSMMEGPIKTAAAATLHLEMHGRAQGASALAQLIVGGSIRPDVFIPVTAGPALTVLRAGKADSAQPIAHTEMVIVCQADGQIDGGYFRDAVARRHPGRQWDRGLLWFGITLLIEEEDYE